MVFRSERGRSMTLWTHRWRFTPALVNDAPDTPGVYALWENDQLLCIGRAEGVTIRERLRDHLLNGPRQHRKRITHYSWEICRDPVVRELEALHELRPPQASSLDRLHHLAALERPGEQPAGRSER
jgi:hypothetical protein